MKEKGMYTGGKPVYGFTVSLSGKLIEDPAEQAVISRVKELRARGLSLRAIANVLAEQGIQSRAAKPFHFQAVARLAA
jgi:hypothetical protein